MGEQNIHHYVEKITEVLVQRYGRQDLGNKRNPFNELLFIILSSKTPPHRYQEVYRNLRSEFPKADGLTTVRWEQVAGAIGRAGLQNRKAKAIVAIARHLKREFGRVTLAPLSKMPDREAEDFLVSLPEVSKKTARCVLTYALKREVFPVDSHCFRTCHRLHWLKTDTQLTDRRADELQDGVPKHLRRDLHVGMVLLGRDHCTPRNPNCRECPILQFCPTGQCRISLLDTHFANPLSQRKR